MTRPLLYGEILFDVLPNGKRVLGGAPFNVAWHLQGFGAQPRILSRIGDDADGAAVLNAMQEWGMDTSAVEIDGERPTGVVRVTLDAGHPSYEIRDDQAYDHVQAGASMATDEPFALLYHGSLALRTPAARAMLAGLRQSADLPSFVDLNLRAPWWERSWIEPLLDATRWLKVSDEELALLEGVAAPLGLDALEDTARRLATTHDLEEVIVTRGAEGAFSVSVDGPMARAAPSPVPELVDTIGAGDAFSAVCILGRLRHWSAAETLERATVFAAAICGIPGATTADRALYRSHVGRWSAHA